MFDSFKANKLLKDKEYTITTGSKTETGVIKHFENDICYFTNGHLIKFNETSKIEKVLHLSREAAFKRFLRINKILENEVDKTGKLYEERLELCSDYFIMYFPEKGFALREGEDLEKAKKEHERILFNNLVGSKSYRKSKFNKAFRKLYDPFLGFETSYTDCYGKGTIY